MIDRYRFLFSLRWLGILLLGLAVSASCVFLGSWQLSRHEERSARNAVVERNYDAPPGTLATVLDDTPVGADDVWRQVRLTGRYEGGQLTLRNRPVTGTTASRVLATFRTDEAGLVVVDRGWLPLEQAAQGLPAYPAGDVELTGRLRMSEAPDERSAPPGEVYAIAPPLVVADTGVEGEDVLDGYVMAAAESPAPEAMLRPFPRPETTPGSHLSYAVQWWLFALGAPVGVVVLARREAAEGGHEQHRPPARRSGPDAAAEDALIDAQLAAQASVTSSR